MAEIRQKIVSCPHGHYYDANKYQSCPYCSAGSFTPTIDPFADSQSSFGRGGDTVPESAGNQFTPTMDPFSAPKGNDGFIPTMDPHTPQNGYNDRMSMTQFVDSSSGPSAPVVG